MSERSSDSARLKQIVREKTGLKNVSVTSGRGTARHWRTVITDTKIDPVIQGEIERIAVKEHLCGTYLTDYGMGIDGYNPCISWNTR